MKRMLRIMPKKMCRALHLHMSGYRGDIGELSVSGHLFAKTRDSLDPGYIRAYADNTAEIAARDDSLSSHKGMRLIAVGKSYITLKNTSELREAFGSADAEKGAAALCSIAYGPLDGVIYDCLIERCETGCRTLLEQHTRRLEELDLGGSLLLLDRWDLSEEITEFLHESGFPFIARVNSGWSADTDGGAQGWDSVIYEEKQYCARVIKAVLPTGETENLVTSLPRKKFPDHKAGSLYFKRWAIPESYGSLEARLGLGGFAGKTKVSVLQDLYATKYLANLTAFARGIREERGDGYTRDIDNGNTVFKLREIFLRLLMEPDTETRRSMLERLLLSIAPDALTAQLADKA